MFIEIIKAHFKSMWKVTTPYGNTAPHNLDLGRRLRRGAFAPSTY
jgi:hypothetical protein